MPRRDQIGPTTTGGGDEAADVSEASSELPVVRIYGDAFEERPIPYAIMSLLMSVGELEDGDKALVPFVDVTLAGAEEKGDEDGPEVLLSEVVTFENAAFVLASLLRDFERACGHLADLAPGRLRPEPARVDRARRYVREALASAQASVNRLDEFLGQG